MTTPLPVLQQRPRGHKPSPRRAELHRQAALRHDSRIKTLPKVTAPSWDCRTLGLVPPIEDQSSCGSCYQFSGAGVCECALIKAGYGKPDGSFTLAEEYGMDCQQWGGCNGGDEAEVIDWCKTNGIPTTQDYGPYTMGGQACKFTQSMKLWKIADYGYCTPGQEQGVAATQDIKNAIAAYGPVSVAVDASGFDAYTGGVISGQGSNIDHAIMIIGWDDSKGNGGAWLIRNQWGTSWGEAGYGWIEYGAYSIGTEAIWATATALPPPPPVPTIPVITSPLTPSAVVGQPFSYQIAATNSPSSYDATGLPPGLAIETILAMVPTGLISGTPTQAGTFSIPISATNASGTGTATLVLIVTANVPVTPTIISVALNYSDGTVTTLPVVNSATAAVVIAAISDAARKALSAPSPTTFLGRGK